MRGNRLSSISQKAYFYIAETITGKKKHLPNLIIQASEESRSEAEQEKGLAAVSVDIIQVEKIGFMRYLLITKITHQLERN